MNEYLLFCDCDLYDHDTLVSDFVESFATADEAIDYYNENFPDGYGGLVARYDGRELTLEYRTAGYSSGERPYRDGWIGAWQVVGGWLGARSPDGVNDVRAYRDL